MSPITSSYKSQTFFLYSSFERDFTVDSYFCCTKYIFYSFLNRLMCAIKYGVKIPNGIIFKLYIFHQHLFWNFHCLLVHAEKFIQKWRFALAFYLVPIAKFITTFSCHIACALCSSRLFLHQIQIANMKPDIYTHKEVHCNLNNTYFYAYLYDNIEFHFFPLFLIRLYRIFILWCHCVNANTPDFVCLSRDTIFFFIQFLWHELF